MNLQFPTFLLLAACIDPPARAQALVWSELESRPRLSGFAACHDSWRGRLVAFGGVLVAGQAQPRLWEWDGKDWVLRHPASSRVPPVRPGRQQMVFDTSRGRSLLFGGAWSTEEQHDLWEWDGLRWELRRPAAGPDARTTWVLAWDEARRNVLAFGGNEETWTYDGALWTRHATVPSPPVSSRMTLAFDSRPGRSHALLVSNGETWEWDALSWKSHGRLGFAQADPPQLVCDLRGARMLLCHPGSGYFSELQTRVWSGSAWQPLATRGAPVSDPSLVVLQAPRGGVAAAGGRHSKHAGLWTLEGDSWNQLARPGFAESSDVGYRPAIGTNWSAGSMLWFGLAPDNVNNELWEFRGRTWSFLSDAGPKGCLHRTLPWDERRDRAVLVEPIISTPPGKLATWEWGGSGWTKLTSPTFTANRGWAAFDTAQGYSLFIFESQQGLATASWDGTSWSIHIGAGTPARVLGIAHDRLRCETLAITSHAQTWRWNGNAWVQLAPPHAPVLWTWAGCIAFDGDRQRIVVVALDGPAAVSSWDGGDWHVEQIADRLPATIVQESMAWDPGSGRLCLHGVIGESIEVVTTKQLLLTDRRQSVSVIGDGCGGRVPPGLVPEGDPVPGQRIALALTSTRAHAPAAFLLGAAGADLPLGPCRLRVDPGQPLFVISALTDQHGLARLPLQIPYDLSIRGLAVHTQALVEDPLVPFTRIAASAGLTLRVGD